VWYRRGGGAAGNVAANTLTQLKDPIAGVEVTNPAKAVGGREAETLQNALLRGPQELHSLRRAVTARDFEQFAIASGVAARAQALTKAQVWAHAVPGTVQVLLVPDVPGPAPGGGPTADVLRGHQTESGLAAIRQSLDRRRPLGTTLSVGWFKYKPVGVRADVIAYRGEDLKAIESRVKEKLSQYVSPLPTAVQPRGWPFNQPLQSGRLYDLILSEPGVKDAENLRMLVKEAPDKRTRSLAADAFQPHTWHAVSGDSPSEALFRSTDDGESWEQIGRFAEAEPGEQLELVRVHRSRAGYVAVVTRIPGEKPASRVYVSDDCGDTFRLAQATAFVINDVAWVLRDQVPALLIASDVGLYQLLVAPGASLQQLLAADLPSDHGFWTVAVAPDARGRPALIAVAAEDSKGVWVSYDEGRSKTYVPIGLTEDVRVLTFQNEGTRTFLWAGVAVPGNVAGKGCYRWGGPNEQWQQFIEGWQGGSCYALATSGSRVFAATYDAGVLTLDTIEATRKWLAPGRDSGLPLKEKGGLHLPVRGVAASPDGRLLMAGTDSGVFLSLTEPGERFRAKSAREFPERVSLPEGALFTADQHEIRVRAEAEEG
jgi:hypothetical protein